MIGKTEGPTDGRPDWNDYFLTIAEAVSRRADCTRRRVGAVIVDRDHRIVSTGYNGAEAGGPSCLKGDCPRGRQTATQVAPGSSYDTGAGACIALHAEQNAIMYAGQARCVDSSLYVTTEPCDGCLRMIRASGLAMVVWPDGWDVFRPAGWFAGPI